MQVMKVIKGSLQKKFTKPANAGYVCISSAILLPSYLTRITKESIL